MGLVALVISIFYSCISH